MDIPVAADVEKWSKVDFGSLGFGDADDLQLLVDQANSYIVWVTGRLLDSSMPAPLAAIAQQAVKMRTEQIAFQSQEDYVEGASDDVVGSFTAGSYSETKHDPTRRGETKILNSWVALDTLLWLLLSTSSQYPSDIVDERRDYWRMILSGVNAPAFAITEVAWTSIASSGHVSSDVPWLVEPRGSLGAGDLFIPGAVNLDAWSW